MPTPTYGAKGSVVFSSLGGVLARTWSANFTRASVDVTAFGGFGRNRISGLLDITGSIAGALDVATATSSPLLWADDTQAATVQLLVETDCSVTFPAVVESANLSVDVAAGSDVTFNFSLASTGTDFANCCTVAWA